MFHTAPTTYLRFTDSWSNADGKFFLSDVRMDIHDERTATFSALVAAPEDSAPWVRCWVSNAVEGSLAETEIANVTPNNRVKIEVQLDSESIPELACIRIEATQFATQHTLHVQLCKGEIYHLGDLRLELNSAESLREKIASAGEAMRAEMSSEWLSMAENASESIAWIHGFAVHDRQSGERVGSGGFKGPPKDGEVEIAYGIDEPFRGRGFATTVATALTRYAIGQSNAVKTVLAHTLPEENASTRVLTKCGFAKVGEVIDPEDGPVWRWAKQREGY